MRGHRQAVLAIVEDDNTRDVILGALQSKDFTIRIARSSCEELSSLLKINPDFIILSVAPQSNTGLMTLGDICQADPFASVIAVSPSKDDSFAMECIRHGASDYLKEPFGSNDVLRVIDRLNNRRKLRKITTEPDIECVEQEDKVLKFGNDIENLPYVINQAVSNASVVCSDVSMLKMALGEIVLNAIEHGNLNITKEEKASATEENRFRELLMKRLDDPENRDKTVTMHVRMTRGELKYTVTDCGQGFEYRKLDMNPHAHLGSGLGLFVARSFFTSVTFRGKGNKVVLVFKKPERKS